MSIPVTQTETKMSIFADTVMRTKYLKSYENGWEDIARRVVTNVVEPYFPEFVDRIVEAVINKEFMPGGRYLANAGKSNMLNNCFLYSVEDTKESIGDTFRKITITGMTGGGVGVVWSKLRPKGAVVSSNGGTSTGPCAFMQSLNEIGRSVVNGGSRRMAIWAGLHWYHPDVFAFMKMKDWNKHVVAAKQEDFSAYGPMDMTNISVILDTAFFEALEDENFSREYTWEGMTVTVTHNWAMQVWYAALENALTTGEPGLSVDIDNNEGENLRNPCCEISSTDSNDVCCLGSINLANISTIDRFSEVVELSTVFLLCGTLKSNIPHPEIEATRTKNRRLGLGLMGIYEWLIQRGYRYEPNDELASWLEEYAKSTGFAAYYADHLNISRPVKTRAIAPAGTIGIIAETTTGIEPLFAVAYKRRYLKDGKWCYQYVVDATAKRLADQYGIDPDDLETAYDLAKDPGRRLEFQAFVQRYVDHGISSTLNLPAVNEQHFTTEEFSATLLQHIKGLRGVTMYPDGARGGQPLSVCSYKEASEREGMEFEEFGLDNACVSGVCGI